MLKWLQTDVRLSKTHLLPSALQPPLNGLNMLHSSPLAVCLCVCVCFQGRGFHSAVCCVSTPPAVTVYSVIYLSRLLSHVLIYECRGYPADVKVEQVCCMLLAANIYKDCWLSLYLLKATWQRGTNLLTLPDILQLIRQHLTLWDHEGKAILLKSIAITLENAKQVVDEHFFYSTPLLKTPHRI